MPFSESIRTKVLLWSDRHCCLCKKPCGINIEVAHIENEVEGGKNVLDNAIPLCFECHGNIGHYNPKHPKGTKIKAEEIKKRREQIYDEFTQHLVPPISCLLTQKSERKLPDVGCELTHRSNSLPVRVLVKVMVLSNNNKRSSIFKDGYYSGKKEWNLNPLDSICGHFSLPQEYSGRIDILVCIDVVIIDQYERKHKHLPVHYRYSHERQDWVLEP